MPQSAFNTGMPSPFKKEYDEMEGELRLIAPGPEYTIEEIGKSILVIERKISWLQEHLRSHTFETEEEEIIFFKHVKPLFYAQLMFYERIYEVILNRPVGAVETVEKYLLAELNELEHHFEANKGFYQYYRSGASYLDPYYFTRARKINRRRLNPLLIDTDGQLSTGHDFVIAEIIANDWVHGYLLYGIQFLKSPPTSLTADGPKSQLTWTAPLTALNEVIYGLIAVGAINNGNVNIGAVAEEFGQFFNVKVGNVYRRQQEIRIRENPSQFLEDVLEKYREKLTHTDLHPRRSTK